MGLGARLDDRMKEVGLTQSELARRVRVTQGAISQLISGSSQGSKYLHKIARELGTTPAYLTGEVDDPEQDAPESPPLTPDEAKMLTGWRLLSAEDRRALDRIMNTMVGPKTLHAPAEGFRAKGGSDSQARSDGGAA